MSRTCSARFWNATAARAWIEGFAFERLSDATRKLDRSRSGEIVGPHGGMIGGAPGSSSLTFPFRDADRAARASRELARALEIGVAR